MRPHGELNVLLVGSADPRHILKTITGLTDSDTLHVSDSFTYSTWIEINHILQRPKSAVLCQCVNDEVCGLLQIWVIENSMEVVARQLVLLYLSLLTPENMSLHSMYLNILYK